MARKATSATKDMEAKSPQIATGCGCSIPSAESAAAASRWFRHGTLSVLGKSEKELKPS